VATDGATFINPPHKAYLISTKDVQSPSFSIETITAIEGVHMDSKRHSEGIYNLAGQKVDESYHSVIIKDGKKILPKKR
jgi:hypothetical protein